MKTQEPSTTSQAVVTVVAFSLSLVGLFGAIGMEIIPGVLANHVVDRMTIDQGLNDAIALGFVGLAQIGTIIAIVALRRRTRLAALAGATIGNASSLGIVAVGVIVVSIWG